MHGHKLFNSYIFRACTFKWESWNQNWIFHVQVLPETITKHRISRPSYTELVHPGRSVEIAMLTTDLLLQVFIHSFLENFGFWGGLSRNEYQIHESICTRDTGLLWLDKK